MFVKIFQGAYENILSDYYYYCSTVFKQRQSLLLHLGCKHGKVNDVLKQKGYAVLPAPILATTNYALQKQLLQIKKEKMDTE